MSHYLPLCDPKEGSKILLLGLGPTVLPVRTVRTYGTPKTGGAAQASCRGSATPKASQLANAPLQPLRECKSLARSRKNEATSPRRLLGSATLSRARARSRDLAGAATPAPKINQKPRNLSQKFRGAPPPKRLRDSPCEEPNESRRISLKLMQSRDGISRMQPWAAWRKERTTGAKQPAL